MTPYRASDGTMWGAEVRMPTHSGAMVIFHHPTGETARLNRYAWINAPAVTAHDPRTSLGAKGLTESLSERELARLFRRSMPIQTSRPTYIVS
jgi:hypothetical protein